MKIQASWTFGNFNVTAAAEIPFTEPVDKLTKAIVEKGFLQLLQRVPASKAEKALAGYEKRPEGFKRTSIPWSEENAIKLAEEFGTEVEVEEGVMLKFAIVDVTENEGSETGQSRKMATEMAGQVRGNPAMLTVLGVDGTDESALIEACHKFLSGLRAKGKDKAKVITAAADKQVEERRN